MSGDPANLIVDRSPFNELVGYRLVEWREDYARLEVDVEERHHNRRGVAHGGVTMTAIDAAGGYCGTHCAVPGHTRMCVTASLTCEFIKPMESGRTLTIEAKRRGGGRGMFFAEMEARDDHGHLIALGHGVYRYVKGSGDPAGIPGKQSTEPSD